MALLPSDPQQQKKLFIALVPALALFGYWYFLHGKAEQEIVALEERLENLETANATARVQAMDGGPELAERVAAYEKHMKRLEELIPSREEVPELLHTITTQSRENDVELALMRPRPETPGPYYSQQTYDLGIMGGYHDIGRFLASVGSLPRIITPVGLRLIARSDTTRSGDRKLEATFRIQTYIVPAPAPPAPAAE